MADYENPDCVFFLNLSKLSDLGLSELKGNNAPHPKKSLKLKALVFEVHQKSRVCSGVKKTVFRDTPISE